MASYGKSKDMIAYVIYKQLLDSVGNVDKVELVEIDLNEKNAHSFSKLYNLQVPIDLRNRVAYTVISIRVQ